MGGGGQFSYPKHVWTPSGGWWTRPHNWVANTFVVTAGIATLTYGVWQYSAKLEQRHAEPVKWIPSMLWAREFKEGKLGIKDQNS
ncbi:hypothetical protein RSOLAG1IB_06210 [Rhizoctonia solani AG-1 IB]|uniref:Uncharacterized protein n=1 Tax=Thanatephorus cucumeris (strain AG1-IB / isolate 7/3/14) TaxID=1108050 RepID=A0A0B7F8M0_THACB|nr:hypothetical protein RSOLAG1IB_06210 [Rhizoctonia solani AG-1 IB]